MGGLGFGVVALALSDRTPGTLPAVDRQPASQASRLGVQYLDHLTAYVPTGWAE